MAIANSLITAVSLLLEAALLVVLVRQRLSRKLPLFCLLLSFYVLRTTLLLLASRSASRGTYLRLFSALSLIDFTFQLGLAVSLFLNVRGAATHSERESPGKLLQLSVLSVGLMLACGATWLMVQIAPSYSPVPPDRATMFCAWAFLALFAWLRFRGASGPVSTVGGGFAANGLASVTSQVARSVAALENQPHAFVFWAYCGAAVWLLVLLFWLFRFASPRSEVEAEPSLTGLSQLSS